MKSRLYMLLVLVAFAVLPIQAGCAPRVSTYPELIDFGQEVPKFPYTAPGATSAPITVKIVNLSVSDVTITYISDVKAPFSRIDNLEVPITIDGHDTLELQFSFSPVSTGKFDAPVTVIATGESFPGSLLFQLSGYGATPGNHPPEVEAGENQTITLSDFASLNGVVNDDGEADKLSVNWSAVHEEVYSGGAFFEHPNEAKTRVTFPYQGTYKLKLHASDGELEATDTVIITVLPSDGNHPPSVSIDSAWFRTSVWVPEPNIFSATLTDDDLPAGNLTVEWSVLEGPGEIVIHDPYSPETGISFSETGSAIIRVRADDGQLWAVAEVSVNIEPEPTNGFVISSAIENDYLKLTLGHNGMTQSSSGFWLNLDHFYLSKYEVLAIQFEEGSSFLEPEVELVYSLSELEEVWLRSESSLATRPKEDVLHLICKPRVTDWKLLPIELGVNFWLDGETYRGSTADPRPGKTETGAIDTALFKGNPAPADSARLTAIEHLDGVRVLCEIGAPSETVSCDSISTTFTWDESRLIPVLISPGPHIEGAFEPFTPLKSPVTIEMSFDPALTELDNLTVFTADFRPLPGAAGTVDFELTGFDHGAAIGGGLLGVEGFPL